MYACRGVGGDHLDEAVEGLTRAAAALASMGMHEEAELLACVIARCGKAGTAVPLPQVFRREGEYWFVVYDLDVFRLKDSKGLRYLAALLASPRREIHVLDLAGGSDTGDAGPMADWSARRAYRTRLGELASELAEAEAWHDLGHQARIKAEIDAVVSELARDEGLGGGARTASSATERARQAVAKALRSALSRISDHSPSLGAHLASTIRTGTYCRYDPDPRAPVTWRT